MAKKKFPKQMNTAKTGSAQRNNKPGQDQMQKPNSVAPKSTGNSQLRQGKKVAETFPSDVALGIKAFAITGVMIFLLQLLRGTNTTESWDKAIYLLSLLIAVAALAMGISKRNFASGKYLYGSLAVLTIFLG